MEYNPVNFTGEHAQEIHAAVLEANRTFSKKLLRSEDNIKNERNLTSISGEVAWQEYKEKLREADIDAAGAKNNWKFGDAKVSPKKMMALDNVTMNQLRNTRFSKDMQAGANNIGSTEFEKAATGYLVPRMGKSYERMCYTSITASTKAAIAASNVPSATEKAWAAAQPAGLFDGLIAVAIRLGTEMGDNKVKFVAGTAVTQANIGDEYTKIFAGIDDAEMEEGNVRIFAPLSDFKLILANNASRQFRDLFTVTGTGVTAEVSFLTVPVEFVPTGVGRMAGKAGESGDFVHATDLLSDMDEFKIGKVNEYTDDLFYKMVATADTTVLNNYKKVLYLPAN